MPLVSIILPTYDRLAFLKESVASVVAQTFADWELIVVDDGSTDGTLAWLATLDDPRVVVLAEGHTGNPSSARNSGAARARGEWLAFLDSDDVWLPEKLATQMRALAEHSTCRWSCTGVGFIDESGRSVPQRGGVSYVAHSGWILDKLLTHAAAATLPTLVVEKRLFDEIGGFDPSLLFQEDFDFVLRLAARSEVHALAEPLTLAREHAGRSTTAARSAELFRFKDLALRKARAASSSRAIRRIAARESARQRIHCAYAFAADGERAQAFSCLASAGAAVGVDLTAWRWILGAGIRLTVGRAESRPNPLDTNQANETNRTGAGN